MGQPDPAEMIRWSDAARVVGIAKATGVSRGLKRTAGDFPPGAILIAEQRPGSGSGQAARWTGWWPLVQSTVPRCKKSRRLRAGSGGPQWSAEDAATVSRHAGRRWPGTPSSPPEGGPFRMDGGIRGCRSGRSSFAGIRLLGCRHCHWLNQDTASRTGHIGKSTPGPAGPGVNHRRRRTVATPESTPGTARRVRLLLILGEMAR